MKNTQKHAPRNSVSYEEIFPGNFGAGGVKKFPWKISSGAQSEHLGPSLTIQEFFSRKYSWFYMQRMPVAPVAQRYHVTSDTLGRELDPGKRDFSH